MEGGAEFVDALKRVGYPKAGSLCGEDFDWLFETLEDQSFLERLCSTLNKQQVLSEEELQAFEALQKSSKAILEGEALEEVLKTCQPLELDDKDDDDEEEEEDGKLQALEDELQALRKVQQLKIGRRNRLQILTSTSNLRSQKVKERQQEMPPNLKEGQGVFLALNTKTNKELQSLAGGAEKLASFLSVTTTTTTSTTTTTTASTTTTTGQPELGPHSLFLAQHDLDGYLRQEEERTTSLTLYTKKQFFQGISELVESSKEEKFQLLDIRNSPSAGGEGKDVSEEREELTRLQLAYVCAQHQLILQKARNQSVTLGLQWAKENVSSLKKSDGKEKFEARISSLNNDISKIKNRLAQINNEALPLLIKEDGELLNMPVVRGDFDLQIARQEYYISRQDQICHQLIKQKASFELLQLAYEIELRKLRDYSRLLENMNQDLKQSSDTLAHTLETMSESSISHLKMLKSSIDLKDNEIQRLYQLLEGKNPKQLFRTPEGLERMAEELHLDIVSILDQLAVTNEDQMLLLSKMDADVIALRDSIYHNGESICLSNQELTDQFQRLEFHLNKLNQLIIDLLTDVKAKKKMLESNKLQQMERKLCVYFFKDQERLKTVVERLEQQVKEQSVS